MNILLTDAKPILPNKKLMDQLTTLVSKCYNNH